MDKKINYQLITDEIISEISNLDSKPKLLLHSCCAPCSSYVLEYLSKYFLITVLYYNPNIDTQEEYFLRAKEQEKIIEQLNLNVGLIVEDHTPQEFYNAVTGLEHIREGGKRCHACFRLRLEKAANYAKLNDYDYFTTSLSISPLKNSKVLNDIGKKIAEKYKIKYLISDFKKKNGYKRSVEICNKLGIYRQDYCGCIFSKNERHKNM